ncbi:MAG: hypothetical protein M5R36_05050 [Deltaproteobacteria bacterium]|nr:hypothetical protein [Deltaproteobacteria bacterium]
MARLRWWLLGALICVAAVSAFVVSCTEGDDEDDDGLGGADDDDTGEADDDCKSEPLEKETTLIYDDGSAEEGLVGGCAGCMLVQRFEPSDYFQFDSVAWFAFGSVETVGDVALVVFAASWEKASPEGLELIFKSGPLSAWTGDEWNFYDTLSSEIDYNYFLPSEFFVGFEWASDSAAPLLGYDESGFEDYTTWFYDAEAETWTDLGEEGRTGVLMIRPTIWEQDDWWDDDCR